MKKILMAFLMLQGIYFLIYCKNEIKSEKGSIDIISNVYFNASKNLDNVQSFHVSRLNYKNDTILEFVPDLTEPGLINATYLISDSTYYELPNAQQLISEVKKNQKAKSVYKKRSGAIFTKDWIPNYQHRRKLSDTILFNKKYLRFEVNSPFSYTRYYVNKTDTILPYSLYKQADIDYKGRIERIDSYNKKQDIFVTLQLIPKKNWDKEAQDFFEFNQFANKKNKN